MKQPNNNWPYCTSKEEPIHCRIVSQSSKDPFRSYQAPNYRCIKEDPVPRTCPGTVSGKEIILAYVLNRVEQPHCHCKVDGCSQNCSYELGEKKSSHAFCFHCICFKIGNFIVLGWFLHLEIHKCLESNFDSS